MTEQHTIEIDSIEARWLLDATRWAKESAEKKGFTRQERTMRKIEDKLKEQLPPYKELDMSV